jgi:hypothetical protein
MMISFNSSKIFVCNDYGVCQVSLDERASLEDRFGEFTLQPSALFKSREENSPGEPVHNSAGDLFLGSAGELFLGSAGDLFIGSAGQVSGAKQSKHNSSKSPKSQTKANTSPAKAQKVK